MTMPDPAALVYQAVCEGTDDSVTALLDMLAANTPGAPEEAIITGALSAVARRHIRECGVPATELTEGQVVEAIFPPMLSVVRQLLHASRAFTAAREAGTKNPDPQP